MERSGNGTESLDTELSTERTLQVLLEIEVSDGLTCSLSAPDSELQDVHNQICGELCHAEVTVEDDSDTARVLHRITHVDESCLCVAFSEIGCVPRFQSADDGVVVVETYVSDRTVLSELVDRLNSVAARVSLRRVTTGPGEGVELNSTTIDLSHLTSKQREAATIAVSRGYYEAPRRISLEELSRELGISKSATSQRLSAVESKLLTRIFDSCSDRTPDRG